MRLRGLGCRARVWLMTGCTAVCLCGVLCAASRARAAAVDGVSDQNLPFWDTRASTGWGENLAASPFAQYFDEVWAREGHISYARYVLQWNAAARGEMGPFEAWYGEVTQDLKLTPVVAFYNFRSQI